MKLIFIIFVFLLQSCITTVFGQIRLSDMELCSADSIQRCNIKYFSPGEGGSKRIWDFSKKLISRNSSQVMFIKDSTGLVSVIEPGKIEYYQTVSDTLVLTSSETPLNKREYVNNKYSKKFPLEFGDTLKKTFMCEGVYCGTHPFREVGTTVVKVDGVGSIILADNDTINNVKRVHTVDSYFKCMDINVLALDTAKLVQIIDECYEWYLPESQYPIIENVTSTTYHNMNVIGTTRYACCNLTADKVEDYITLRDDETIADNCSSFDEEQTKPEIIHYRIEIVGGIIKIAYNLDSDAFINTIVANHMGVTYRYKSWIKEAGQGFTTQIDCSGLRSGTYILYINVNGNVYSEKVLLQ